MVKKGIAAVFLPLLTASVFAVTEPIIDGVPVIPPDGFSDWKVGARRCTDNSEYKVLYVTTYARGELTQRGGWHKVVIFSGVDEEPYRIERWDIVPEAEVAIRHVDLVWENEDWVSAAVPREDLDSFACEWIVHGLRDFPLPDIGETYGPE